MESYSYTQIQSLLSAVKTVADHQAEIRRLKGEDFNVFSILGMETAENKTHSAFLGELLNPKGSHGMGKLFLGLFLKAIEYPAETDKLSASVMLEKHIGYRDDEAKEGGRIDIYIALGDGRTVSIENKIYAMDQFAQIVRYAKHNQEKNTVYYLTLDGSDPSDESRGALKHGAGYRNISYRKEIIDWLEQCMKEAADLPILRESIKQYRILIQKLTGQMTEDKMKAEIHDLIAKNYEAARLVAGNFVGGGDERGLWIPFLGKGAN